MKTLSVIAALLISLFSAGVYADAVPCAKAGINLKDTRFRAEFALSGSSLRLCAPLDVPSHGTYVMEDGTTRNLPGWINATCGANKVCTARGQWAGNAPKGDYVIETGWYLGVGSHGDVVAYEGGTGPAFGGHRYEPVIAQLQPGEKFHVTCPVNDSAYCSLAVNRGVFTLTLEKLPEAGFPMLKPEAVEAQGGNCDSVPMCYDSNGNQIGLNAEYFN